MTLKRRLMALEASGRNRDFAHLSDEDLVEQFIGTVERLEREGIEPRPGWRADIEREPVSAMQAIFKQLNNDVLERIARCEI